MTAHPLRRGDLLFRTKRFVDTNSGWSERIDFAEVVHTDPILGVPWAVARRRDLLSVTPSKRVVTIGRRVGMPMPLINQAPVWWHRCSNRRSFTEHSVSFRRSD